jgi:hypothetical protein
LTIGRRLVDADLLLVSVMAFSTRCTREKFLFELLWQLEPKGIVGGVKLLANVARIEPRVLGVGEGGPGRVGVVTPRREEGSRLRVAVGIAGSASREGP